MKQEISEAPIICVLIVLGLLSYIAAFQVADLKDESFLIFDVTAVVGFLCGLIALPIGFKLSRLRLDEAGAPAQCYC